jgi:hypothetical protein
MLDFWKPLIAIFLGNRLIGFVSSNLSRAILDWIQAHDDCIYSVYAGFYALLPTCLTCLFIKPSYISSLISDLNESVNSDSWDGDYDNKLIFFVWTLISYVGEFYIQILINSIPEFMVVLIYFLRDISADIERYPQISSAIFIHNKGSLLFKLYRKRLMRI